jgi:probable HAF family extracellular repeat protein
MKLSRVLLVATLGLILPYPVLAQQYSLRLIATLGSLQSQGFGINNQFQVVGETPVKNIENAFLWSSATKAIDIGAPGSFSAALAVNDFAQIVGAADSSSGQTHAFLWTEADGLQDLGTLGGFASFARAINVSGHAVGNAFTSRGTGHASLWTAANGIQDLGTLDSDPLSSAFGINDKEQVVGTSYDGGGRAVAAFLWTPVLGMRKLPFPVGAVATEAFGINNQGQIVGRATDIHAHRHAVLWPHLLKGGVQDLGTLGGSESVAYAINASGVVVGSATVSSGSFHAFSWTAASGMQDLDAAIPGNTRWVVFEARAINGVGKTVVNAFDKTSTTGNLRAAVLSPLVTATTTH